MSFLVPTDASLNTAKRAVQYTALEASLNPAMLCCRNISCLHLLALRPIALHRTMYDVRLCILEQNLIHVILYHGYCLVNLLRPGDVYIRQ